ncbi:hypothetical protein V8J36_13150 [Frigidibacter sp. MR17.14]|uniref:hypothetical protein n=1 Tax=Frigidibacter sp. MR17.14 TaxID=3126509 RepID=UPI003012A5A1
MRLFLTLAALALPLPAAAEGARIVLDCTTQTRCDPQGGCASATGSARFTLAPVTTDAGGAGSYSLSLGDGAALEAKAPSRTGPWVWLQGGEVLMTLALSGETSAVWIRQSLAGGGSAPATIDLMTCEVTA